jgi:hypothetical protein
MSLRIKIPGNLSAEPQSQVYRDTPLVVSNHELTAFSMLETMCTTAIDFRLELD